MSHYLSALDDIFHSIRFTCFQEGVNHLRHFGIFYEAYLEELPQHTGRSKEDNLCFTLISWLGAVLTPTIVIQSQLLALPDELSANNAATVGRTFIKLQTLQALIYHYEGGQHFENTTEDLWFYIKENSGLLTSGETTDHHTIWLFLSLLFSLPTTSSILDDDWLAIKEISAKLPPPSSNGPHLIFRRAMMLHKMVANRDDLHTLNIQPTLSLPDNYLDLPDEIKYIKFCHIYFIIIYSTGPRRPLTQVGQMDLLELAPDLVRLSHSLPRWYRLQTFRREFNLLDLMKASIERNPTIMNTKWQQWRAAAIAFARTCPGLWDDHGWLEESDSFLRAN
ncbi:hypothetical protein NLG97_g5903 [Lecanicillium saksenae]|uniref:Uncharacterized protein n=1 Tax=Lecanicillium saksenae TaxID=468837 RepID=A0ACC1QSA4_9HYPO|nr:hypothetical protein NLG97_g5903 [Lecanicillium saksenae]